MDKRYPSDLSDAHWSLVQPTFESSREHGGRPRKRPARERVNAIVTVMRNGCVWRALPKDFPPWQTVVTARRRWQLDGTLGRALSALARAGGRNTTWLSSIRCSSSPASAAKAAPSTDCAAPRD